MRKIWTASIVILLATLLNDSAALAQDMLATNAVPENDWLTLNFARLDGNVILAAAIITIIGLIWILVERRKEKIGKHSNYLL